MSPQISGIFAPITTPFVNEEPALDQLKTNVHKYRETGLAGFFALGSNGESKSLTEDEKLQVLQVVLEGKAPHQIVMAGTGYESTRQTIAFSKKAAEMGAAFVSILTPSYFKKTLTDDAMAGYYQDIADAVPVPVLIYNAPGFTGMTVSPKVIEKISQHPNIAGMKDTSPAGMSGYLAASAESFTVLSGTISTLFQALALGAKGGVVSLADAFPGPCCELFDKFMSGDTAGARKLHYTLFKLNHSVSGSYGVAGVKYAMELGGYQGGPPRLPLLPLKDADRQKIRSAVEAEGLL